MTPIHLTEGAIPMLFTSDAPETNVVPVLQVAEITLLKTSNENERYQIWLSDGTFSQQGMLDKQRDDLVRSGKLRKGSIVQLKNSVLRVIQNRSILLIIDLDVLHEKSDRIGEPKLFKNEPVQTVIINPHSDAAGSVMGGSWPNVASGVRVQSTGMVDNRGPIAQNEVPPRIIPIAALNPYQGRWTIRARVTAKSELRHYNNARGSSKMFSFDLLDSDGMEIRVKCFDDVADQFYHQIEPCRVYLIANGTLRLAEKAFNHIHNDHEILLQSISTVQRCLEDDKTIPLQQFHFCAISNLEGKKNSSIVDVLGVVSSISPSSSVTTKIGTETLKRTLQLNDRSGRCVELTLWENFCNVEGQKLQILCDSRVFPVLAVKSCSVRDFYGKVVWTISISQLFIEPDIAEAHDLKAWFDNEGKNANFIPVSRWPGVHKTISQIKDERLGTSDWVTVCASLAFVKMHNFFYTACPIIIGDHQCNKKVTHNGDGKWRCDRCNQLVDECDYRYNLQMKIQDHTDFMWITAFQEGGEEIFGRSAKDLYFLEYEERDDENISEVMRKVLSTKYLFTLKVKEDTFNYGKGVKYILEKAEKVNFQTETKNHPDSISKFKMEDSGSLHLDRREHVAPITGSTSTYTSCRSCGGAGHDPENCPSIGDDRYRRSFGHGTTRRVSSSGENLKCFKCHLFGHWAWDCPGF